MTALPSGTVTFLFTDLEGSTRLWEERPGPMEAALVAHDAILRESVESTRGAVVDHGGDGMCAVFASASDAIAAGLQFELRIAASDEAEVAGLLPRVALHAGEGVLRSDGRYMNQPLNRCARLLAAGHGGQMLASESVEALVRDGLPPGVELIGLGEHRLRDLARPMRVFQLVHPELRRDFPPLRSLDAFPGNLQLQVNSFVGRDRELAGRAVELETLERAWQKATGGAPQVVMIGGDPGIGKTALVGDFARRVDAEGAVVLYGRSDEDAVVPYQPFVEALRSYVAACPVSTLRERLHGLEADLTRVFPELLGRMPELSTPTRSERDSGLTDRQQQWQAERYRLFEAFTALITGIAATQPIMLVLDDMHWADQPTLQLSRHLLRAAQHAAILAVGCYRDHELERGHPLTDVLADLRRDQSVTWVSLRGLSQSATAHLVRSIAGDDVTAALVDTLHRETGGNPLFLEEVVRHLIETDALAAGGAHTVDLGRLDLPQGVRDVVTRRVRRLPDDVGDLLGLGSVVGPEFDVTLIARLARKPIDEVLDLLDDAIGRRTRHRASRPDRALLVLTRVDSTDPLRRAQDRPPRSAARRRGRGARRGQNDRNRAGAIGGGAGPALHGRDPAA